MTDTSVQQALLRDHTSIMTTCTTSQIDTLVLWEATVRLVWRLHVILASTIHFTEDLILLTV